MASINELIDAIVQVLLEEKAYDIPTVCTKYGLESGDEWTSVNRLDSQNRENYAI